MGNCLSCSNYKKTISLPIDKVFKFPSPIPTSWPPGGSFSSGYIDLGGIEVHQISSLSKIWATFEGGEDDLGATFFEPSAIPDGFFMVGCYCQPNNRQFFGWVLVAKDTSTSSSSDQESAKLAKPIDYILVWSSHSNSKNNKNGNVNGYIWFPVPPQGYRALGYVVTTVPDKPSLEKIRCVRSDFTDECEADSLIWSGGGGDADHDFHVYSSRPKNKGTKDQGVCTGTFTVSSSSSSSASADNHDVNIIACLKNNNLLNFSAMPNLDQIQALVQTYSPLIYLHPKEKYLPSSVNWYFENGALLYKKGEESNPLRIETNGSNLPQNGSNDGQYWLDLPIEENEKEHVKKGDLQSAEAYLHVKPMLGATHTDIAIWIFYPFNGPATAKIGLIDIPLGKIGEHVGDWEHLTLRISNFNGVLQKMYFSQHSRGKWVEAPLLEYYYYFTNRPVAYSARNGHPFYPKPGLVLQGIGDQIGIRNDTGKSSMVMDTGSRYSVVSAEYLGSQGTGTGTGTGTVVEPPPQPSPLAPPPPPWLNFGGEWGPKIRYELGEEVEKIEGILSGDMKWAFERLVRIFPDEIYGEEGPTGPKMKTSWYGDER